MKLPSVGTGQVQGFQNPSIQTIAAQAGAGFNAVASGLNTAAVAYQEYQQKKINLESRDAAMNMSKGMTEFQQKYAGRDYIGVDELPDTVKISRTRKQMNPDGTIEEVEVDKVPAYEVMPDLLKHYQTALVTTNAELISDPEARKEWLQKAQMVTDEEYIRELVNSRQAQSKFIEDRTISDIETAVQSGKFELAKELSASFDNPSLASKANELIIKAEYLDGVDRLILDKNADPDSIDASIAELQDPDSQVPLSANERMAKINALEASKERVLAATYADQERSRQLAVSNAWLAIDEGNVRMDESAVDDLFEQGLIDGGTRTAMIRGINTNRTKLVEYEVNMAELNQIAAAGYGIDPKNKDLRKLVDQQFEIRANETGDPWAAATESMRQFKVVPSQIAGMFRSANRAESPELARALPLFMEAQDYAPEALKDFSDSDVDVLENVAANVRLGMDLPSAIATTQKWASLTPDEKRTLKDNARMAWDSNNAMLDDLVSDHPSYDKPWSVKSPEVTNVMRQEYDSLVERILPTVGFDIAVAQRKAFGRITKSWQMTDINGDYKLMKNMPQAPTDDVRKQIRSTYKEYLGTLSNNTGREFKESDVKIVSDSLTQIQLNRGEKPTYQSFIVLDQETQEIEMLPRFQWDGEQASKKRKNKIMGDAKKERQKFLEKQQFEDEMSQGTWRDKAAAARNRREQLMLQEQADAAERAQNVE